MCYNATYLRSWDYFCFLTKKKLKKSGYKKSVVFFLRRFFCLVPEPVEGNAGASTSSATDKLKVQQPIALVLSSQFIVHSSSSSICTTESGMLYFVEYPKAESLIEIIVSGSVTFFKASHLSKTLSSINVIERGMLTFFKDSQY